MGPNDAVTVSMVWVGTGVGGLFFVGGTVLWAAYRFVKSEREKGEDKIMTAVKAIEQVSKAEDEKLHSRISAVRDETVRREDYHADQRRVEGLLGLIRDEIRSVGQRIDGLYDHRPHRAGGD